MSGSLSGIRVVDLTQVLAGPYATQQLGFMGAEIVKLEHPQAGDQSREMMPVTGPLGDARLSPMFVSMNAGKRSVTLDLKKPEAREILHRLVARADVLVQNFKAGTMERMGWGWEALREINPRLVYCSISGYGQTGPKARLAAYDPAIQAASGMMSITGHPETGPVKTGYWVTDMATGMTAAFAIASALVERAATGHGRHVDVSMLDTAISFLGPIVSNYLNAGVVPGLYGNRSQTGSATADLFPTRRGFLLLVAATAGQYPILCRTIGRPDLAADPRFATREQRLENAAVLRQALTEAFATADASEWEERLGAAGVPAAAVATLAEAVASEQVVHRRLVRSVPGPGRDLAFVGAPYKLDGGDAAADAPPPRLGEHTDAVLGEHGFSAEEIAAFRTAGAI